MKPINKFTRKLVNLTPHEVVILAGCDRDNVGSQVVICPSGIIARVQLSRVLIDVVNVNGVDVEITSPVCEKITGLPEPEDGVYYIVSRMVAEVKRDRQDLVVPDKVVRSGSMVKYCRAFSISSLSSYPVKSDSVHEGINLTS